MKKCFFVVLLLFVMSINSNVQNKNFGVGVIIGEPTGLSAKIWTSNLNALAIGLGWYIDGLGKKYDNVSRTHIHVDYLWHSMHAINSSGQFPLYYGIGGRVNTGPQYEGSLAVRGILGIVWLPHNTPLDIFIEVAPTLTLISSTGFDIDAGIGARFFF